jgi:hypothetical protein
MAGLEPQSGRNCAALLACQVPWPIRLLCCSTQYGLLDRECGEVVVGVPCSALKAHESSMRALVGDRLGCGVTGQSLQQPAVEQVSDFDVCTQQMWVLAKWP